MPRPRLVISENECGFLCRLCGKTVTPRLGPELFVDGQGFACWDCGRTHAPRLVAQLEAHYATVGAQLVGTR